MLQRPQSVILYASQIAACIGCNRHKKPAEAMEAMWERMAPDSYRDALRRTGCTTELDRLQELIRNDEVVKRVLDDSSVVCDHSQDVAAKYDSASRAIAKFDMAPDDIRAIDATV
jgi:hypothetical protein